MTTLPSSLAPWRRHLALFPPELQLSVGSLASRIALLFGPIRRSRARSEGELDGYAGLERRGPYERLLTSEWLLADELPDEFLRRAAMGEHAFLSPARREQVGIESCTALFDAGPWQLGGPRIVHVALLIVLAQRAEDAGVPFDWGILQEPGAPLVDGVTNVGVMRLLGARTADAVSAEHVAQWRDRLGRVNARDDLWIVGSPLIQGISGASSIAVSDVLEPGSTAVDVEVRVEQRAPRRARLALPSEDAGIRLLRDPFHGEAAETQALMPPTRVVRLDVECAPVRFLVQRNRLLVKLVGEGWAAVHVPDNTRTGPGKPVFLRTPPGAQIAAIGWRGKRLEALIRDGDKLRSSDGEWAAEPFGPNWGLDGDPAELLRDGGSLFVFDNDRKLFRCPRGGPATLIDDKVIFVVRRPAAVEFLAPDGDGGLDLLTVSQDGSLLRNRLISSEFGGTAFHSWPTQWGAGVMAKDDGTWVTFGGRTPIVFRPPGEARVVGLTAVASQGPRLVYLALDRQSLWLLDGRERTRKIFETTDSIRHAAVSPYSPFIACVLRERRVVVFHADGSRLLDILPTEAA